VENAKCLENKTVTNEGVQEEITESLRSVKKFYLLGMYILCKWGVLLLGKICLFTSYFVPTLMQRIEILMWNKGYNSRITAAEVIYKNWRDGRGVQEYMYNVTM
jgi:hypothetical protein